MSETQSDRVVDYIAFNVKHILKQKGMSQSGLSRRLECLPQQLSHQLTGRRDFRISFIDRLAKALGVTPDCLTRPPSDASPSSRMRVDDRLKLIEEHLLVIKESQGVSELPEDLLTFLTRHPQRGQLIEMARKLMTLFE